LLDQVDDNLVVDSPLIPINLTQLLLI